MDMVGGKPTLLNNMKVNWDDEIPNVLQKIKSMFQTTNQVPMWSNDKLLNVVVLHINHAHMNPYDPWCWNINPNIFIPFL